METVGTIISWAVFGLVIGLIARMLYPGRQPMGFIATMILGIVGSLLGGFLSYAFGFRPEEGAFPRGRLDHVDRGSDLSWSGSGCLLAPARPRIAVCGRCNEPLRASENFAGGIATASASTPPPG